MYDASILSLVLGFASSSVSPAGGFPLLQEDGSAQGFCLLTGVLLPLLGLFSESAFL